MKKVITGKQLCKAHKIDAKHALYREDGKWYHQLRRFPGVLFDKNGYIIFKKRSEYLKNPYLQIKKDLHIRNGISCLIGYSRFDTYSKNNFKLLVPAHNKSSKKKGFLFRPSSPIAPSTIIRNNELNLEPKEISKLHREISIGLYSHLVRKFGKKNISCDCATTNFTFIDMVRRNGKSFVFYEIKTYSDLRKSIREAFGQLMEYAYLGGNQHTSELIIISDKKPNKVLQNYLKFIRKRFSIPLYYQRFLLEEKILSKKF